MYQLEHPSRSYQATGLRECEVCQTHVCSLMFIGFSGGILGVDLISPIVRVRAMAVVVRVVVLAYCLGFIYQITAGGVSSIGE